MIGKCIEKLCKYYDEETGECLYFAMGSGYPESMPCHQEQPEPVIYHGDGYADGKAVYDEAECPECGYAYEDGDKDWGEPYCPHCGQPLKWEDE